MTVNTLLKMLDVTRNTSENYIVNIMMDGYGKPLNAKVEDIRIHEGSVFIKATGIDNSIIPGKESNKNAPAGDTNTRRGLPTYTFNTPGQQGYYTTTSCWLARRNFYGTRKNPGGFGTDL